MAAKKAKRTTKKGSLKKANGKKVAPLTYEQRGREAIKLRKRGKTWKQIAEALGFANGGAANNCAAKYVGGYDQLPEIS